MANVLIISVLERKSGIGLRRVLGATRNRIRVHSSPKAVLLTFIGGTARVGAGALSTTICTNGKDELIVIPPLAWGGGIGASLLIGAIVGLWPADAPLACTRLNGI